MDAAARPDLATLRALLDAATPGPWVLQVPGDNDPGAGTVFIDTHAYSEGPEPVVAPSYPLGLADAILIVALRNQAAALLAEIERRGDDLGAAALEAIATAERKATVCSGPCMYPQHHSDDESGQAFANRLQGMARAALTEGSR